MWNKKLDEFALLCRIRPSTAFLLRWILRRSKVHQVSEIEIDLNKFNRWIAKQRGKPYDRRTLGEAMYQLDTMTKGMICITKRYTPWIYKIVVRPLEFLSLEEQPDLGEETKGDNAGSSDEGRSKSDWVQQQQQNINRVEELVGEVGLKYDRGALAQIWRFSGKSLERIKRAIELMLYRHSSEEIARPHGFLLDCLKYRWQEGFDLYYQPDLPRFNSRQEIMQFCANL